MTVRRPLVVASGTNREIPVGDALAADVVIVNLAQTADIALPAGTGVYVPGSYEIGNGVELSIGDGAVFEVG
jgi:hypothetical protein